MTRVVMLGGGSGSRDLTMALCRAGWEVTRVVPAWDSGGSSRALRDSLGILALGDIRQALMTLAHGQGRVSSVVRFFNARLSESSDATDLRAEFNFYLGGAHPLLASMAPDIREAILRYLQVFNAHINAQFSFQRGSIGNFVLAGAYLAHGRDINQAIQVFRQLCAIQGQVWPSTTHDDVALWAELRDGQWVHGQDRVTALSAAQAQVGIAQVRLGVGGPGGSAPAGPPATAPAPVQANPSVLQAIAQADLLLWGPGSFFTSTLAHLCVAGLADAVRATAPRVPKVFISNILECPETLGRSVAEEVQAFQQAGGPGLLSHVLLNRGWVPVQRVLHGHRYLREGPALPAELLCLADDVEDPWHRGRHDAPKLCELLQGLTGASAAG